LEADPEWYYPTKLSIDLGHTGKLKPYRFDPQIVQKVADQYF